MYDTVENSQFPAGAQAYAAYVNGGIGDQPNYNYVVSTFPNANHLSISLFASQDADALDVEPGAASPSDVPGWYNRQKQSGSYRPCIYASVSTMASSILSVLSQAKIPLSEVRLWSAHYGAGQHICGPASCGLISVEMDGTQWTNNALGRNLDESLLQGNFFDTSHVVVTTEAELQSGQLVNGKGAMTVVAVPPGTAHHIAFGADNSLQGHPPQKLRVGIRDVTWHIDDNVVVDSTKGLTILPIPDPSKTGVISIARLDEGKAEVGYVVY
jgi:hypothetical protein